MNKALKIANLVSRIAFNVFLVLFGIAMIFTAVYQDGTIANAIDGIFGKPVYETVETGSSKPPVRHKSWYSSVEDVLNGNGAVAEIIQTEGTVLLKNDGALPIAKDSNVSLFGVNAYSPIYSLDGAGEVKVNASRQQFFADEFREAGLNVNTDIENWYKSNLGTYGRGNESNMSFTGGGGQNGRNVSLKGAPWSAVEGSGKIPASGGGTAVFVTGRITNEDTDIMPKNVGGMGAKDNDYLKFTDNELSVLSGLKQAKADGKYDKIVVIFNQANPPQEDLPELFEQYTVDGALWIGTPGSDGIAGVASLMVGDANPSGGLPNMWYSGMYENPSSRFFGASTAALKYEGVYIGYRYAETRYEDYVLGNENAGTYNYDESVSYPFGYGMSYSDFTYELVGDVQIDTDREKNYYTNYYTMKKDEDGNAIRYERENKRANGDDLFVEVKVTNTSDTPGKENVQIYLQKPVSPDDEKHGVQKPSVELVGYGKTGILGEGESETLRIKIDANKYFASFDRQAKNGKGGYTVANGTYYLTAARNSHDAINNILLKKGVNADQKARMFDVDGGTAGDAALTWAYTPSADWIRNYEYWTNGGAEVVSLFDYADPLIQGADSNTVKFMSRYDWEGTVDKFATDREIGDNFAVGISGAFPSALNGSYDLDLNNVKTYYPEIDTDASYPTYGKNRTESGGEMSAAPISLADMVGVEYDPRFGATDADIQKWNDFLDQLTWEETAELIGSGLRRTTAITGIGKPYTNDVNASNAISWHFNMGSDSGQDVPHAFAAKFDSSNRNYYPTGYPYGGIIAAAFDTDVAYMAGQAIGEDALWSGASGLYGFGLGLHRNPYHGRVGEYYSEDPFLAGMSGGYQSKGAQSKGLYVYNKHFVLNDQEASRTGYSAWLTEQTFREVYLRSFEIAIEVGDAMNVMTSFNKIGNLWSANNYNLMTKWLRGEAGMRGFAVTDWYRSGGMNMTYGLLAGNDLPDGSQSNNEITKHGPDGSAGGNFGYYGQAARQAAQRILYTVANSNAMNFLGTDTKIVRIDPVWYGVRDGIITAITILFIVSTLAAVGTAAFGIVMKLRKGTEPK